MYDLMIKNARIIDGTGAPWTLGDVAVQDGKIAAVGSVSGAAKAVVDAGQRYLTPGFIDIHSHSDGEILRCPTAESRILQGVTTDVLPVHHQLPESTQTHVHCVHDASQPSHPLSSSSPPALNLSQHQGLFK